MGPIGDGSNPSFSKHSDPIIRIRVGEVNQTEYRRPFLQGLLHVLYRRPRPQVESCSLECVLDARSIHEVAPQAIPPPPPDRQAPEPWRLPTPGGLATRSLRAPGTMRVPGCIGPPEVAQQQPGHERTRGSPMPIALQWGTASPPGRPPVASVVVRRTEPR